MKKVREVKRAAKVGETIKIVKEKKNWHTPSVYIGDKYVVTEVGSNSKGQYIWTDKVNRFHESDKEYVVLEEYEDENDFTLDDLKPCMVVKLRNGNIFIVSEFEKGLALNRDDGWMNLKDWGNDFIFKRPCSCDWDIVEVYGFGKTEHYGNKISVRDRRLLWKRTEKSESELKIEKLEEKQRQIASEIEELRKGLK